MHSRGSPTPSAWGKSELATSPLHSQGPKTGRNCYVTPAFSGVPNAKCGDKIVIRYLTPAFSRAQTWVELLRNLCILEGPQRQVQGENQIGLPHPFLLRGAQKREGLLRNPCILGGPQRQVQGENRNWLPHPCILAGLKQSGIASYPLHSRVFPNAKRGRHNRNWLPHPCLLGNPKQGGIAT